MEQTKTFVSTVKDNHGGVFANSLVSVYAFGEFKSRSGIAKSVDSMALGDGGYEVVNVYEKITYKANFWYSDDLRRQGFKSRPVLIQGGDKLTQVHEVDLTSSAVMIVLESQMSDDDRLMAAIEADFGTRNN